jgi:hypothetical protein
MSVLKILFAADNFVGGECWTAEDKSKFGLHFAKFVEAGFPFTMFHDWFYRRLSNCFGHIAHYDRRGFYETWFTSARKQFAFIENAMRYPTYGDPEYTFCDVERRIKSWLSREGILEKALYAAQREANEAALIVARAALAKLTDEQRVILLGEMNATQAPAEPVEPIILPSNTEGPDNSTQLSIFNGVAA